MTLRANELKAHAKAAMAQAAPPPLLVTLLFTAMTTGVVELIYLFLPSLSDGGQLNVSIFPLFLSILLVLYQVVMSFGYSFWALWVAREQDEGLPALLEGFGMVGRVLIMELRITAGMLARLLMLSTAYVILGTTVLLPDAWVTWALFGLVTVLYCVGVFTITLRYALCPFVLADQPELGGIAAVHRGIYLASPQLWPLFRLQLSFWPWYLLELALCVGAAILILVLELGTLTALLTMEVTSLQITLTSAATSLLVTLATIPVQLFLKPYQTTANATFYLSLLQQERARQEMPPL